jgi:8-oxo-dGTP pyrophosphatase MutT (NUDIX family)
MNDTNTSIAPPLPAATVVILRDGREGLEVFMVVRHQEIDFASGALVFPGGKVDPQDADAAWADLAPYAAAAPDRAFVVAAVRETFEEAGLVLARRRGTRAMLDAGDTHRLVETYRAPLLAGETTFLDLVRAEDLLLATDLMVPFAHWITPERVGKRFDTHFLLVAAPVDQLGAHDGGVAATRASPIVTVTPRIERTANGRKLHIPAEAGYGVTEVLVPAPKR